MLTVGSYCNPGSEREEKEIDDVSTEEEPAQGGKVEEPDGCVRVQDFMEQSFKVRLPIKGPDRPQSF